MLSIEPFAWVVALMPLIGYLIVIGVIRFSGRVLVTTGGREISALAIAVGGLVAVGPAELLFPTSAATVFGPMVWLALLVFYALVVTLIAITSVPKLVIQGRTTHESYTALLAAAKQLDAEASGDQERLHVHLPTLNVHLRIDGIAGIDYCRVVSFDPINSYQFWNALLGAMRSEFAGQNEQVPRRGMGMLVTAGLLSFWLLTQAFSHTEQLVEGFRDWLWR